MLSVRETIVLHGSKHSRTTTSSLQRFTAQIDPYTIPNRSLWRAIILHCDILLCDICQNGESAEIPSHFLAHHA